MQDAALEKDVDFWISLCSQFEVGEQLASLHHILGFLLQLPDDKDEGAASTRVFMAPDGNVSRKIPFRPQGRPGAAPAGERPRRRRRRRWRS